MNFFDFIKKKFNMEKPVKKIIYQECPKSGYHLGQLLNMVCMQSACSKNLLCCNVCIQTDHKNHKVKPLKLLITDCKQNLKIIQPINKDIVFELVQTHKQQSLRIYNQYKKQIIESINKHQTKIIDYYNDILSTIKAKTIGSKKQIDEIFDSIYSSHTLPQLSSTVQKIVKIYPNQNQSSSGNLSQNQLMQKMNQINQQMTNISNKNFEAVVELVNSTSKKFNSYITDLNESFTRQKFTFSKKYKHGSVEVLNPKTVKSVGGSQYKFAIMQPNIPTSSTKFFFKIKQCFNNWIAIGMCNRNTIESKKYGFTYSSIGHGAYMISTNGGTWSNIKSEANNLVKAFHFGKDDIIQVQIKFEIKKIRFLKKKTNESYELDFEIKQNEKLYPCALFYYANDEVEFLDSEEL